MPHLTLPHIFPLFSRTFALLPLPFPLFNPRFLNFVRCSRVFATSPFPNTRKRCIIPIYCNRQLEYSQPEALRKLCRSSIIQLLNKPVDNLSSPYLPPEGNTITVVLHSTTPACIPIAYSLLNNCPERPIAYTLYKPPMHCFHPSYFHILPAIPRIRLRMPCTGFLYSRGIISHPYVKIDYSSILPPEQKWLFNGSYISPSLSITSAYPLIKNSRPKFNGRLYLFLYY